MNRRLTAEQAQAIINRVAAGERQKDLAQEFGVTPSNICRIIRGKSWPDLDRPATTRRQRRCKLTENDVRVILRRLAASESPAAIAKDFGVTRQAIADIQKGKTWPHVPRQVSGRPQRRRVWEQ